jgi:alpha-tubulin suppressor-like RCC1 family protein
VSNNVRHWGSFFGGREGNFGLAVSPAIMTLPGAVTQVGTSNSTQYALLADGSLWAWGLGTQGQLGDGRERSSFTRPVRVRFPGGVKISYIPTDAMPYDTGLAVDTQGRAWGWGRNRGGELCRDRGRIFTRPVRVPLGGPVTTLAGASNHAVYDAAGTVYACGQNVAGDLGDGSNRSSATPVKVARLGGTHVTRLVASFANSGALLADGEYLDWGYDANGQLGDGHFGRSSNVPVRVNLPAAVTQVAQGGSLWNNGQTVVLLSDGSLWSWGAGRFYQLGNRASGARATPGRFRAPAGVTFQSVATGSATSYAIAADGKVYAWGTGQLGQVGNGRTQAVREPVVVASGAAGISATANNVAISVLPPP